jgi:invasion protein IalB
LAIGAMLAVDQSVIAQQIDAGFVGVQRIGAWNLVCEKVNGPPAGTKQTGETAQEAHGATGAPKPSVHCRVDTKIDQPGNPQTWMHMAFSLDPQRFLTVFMQLAPGLAGAGDYLDLRLNDGGVRVKVLFCGPGNCIAVPVIRPQDIPGMKITPNERIAAAKTAVLTIPARAGGKPVAFRLPLDGLQPAIAAMRRANR